MNISQLKTFLDVVEQGRKEQSDGISDTGWLEPLENELGLILFERTEQGLKLTSPAKALAEQATEVVRQADALLALAREMQGQINGTLRVGMYSSQEFLRIAGVGQLIADDFPGLQLHFLPKKDREDLFAQIEAGELDCGFVLGDHGVGDQLTLLTLCHFNLSVAGPRHWQTELQEADWSGLVSLPWVWSAADCPWQAFMGDIFAARGLQPTAVAHPLDEKAMVELIIAGAGVGLMIEDEAQKAQEAGQIAIWPAEVFPVHLSFAFPKKQQSDPAIQAMLTTVRRLWLQDG